MKRFASLRLLAVAALLLCSYSASAAAPAEFLKKVPISLSASAQTTLGQETLSGFPVLVRLSSDISGFSYDDIATNRSDIAFGTDDGSVITPYPFEIDTWNTNGTSLVWVRVPSLAAASSFNLYYGKGGSVANTPSDVWTGYAGVWHLNEASGTAYDSTINGLDATASGANVSECVAVSTAPTGTGRQLASVKAHKSYLSIPNYNSLGLGGTFAISAWAKADACYTTYSARYFSRKAKYTDTDGWEAEQRYDQSSATVPATTISARGANSGDYTATLPDITANWVHVVLSYNGKTLQYYVNGAKAETCTLNSAATDNGKALSFGNNPSGGESNWVGAMDEIRLRGFVPTEAWEAAEYATVANPAFLVYGAVVEIDADAPVLGASSASVSSNDVAFSVALESLSGPTTVSVFYSADGGATFTQLSLGTANAPGTLTGSASDLNVGTYVWYAQAISSVGGTDHPAQSVNRSFTVFHAKDPAAACKRLTATIAYSGAAVSGVPVLLRLSESIEDFHYSDVTASGFEFLDEAGNLLPYEIDTWNTNGTSLIWVLPPAFADGAELTIRYGTDFSNPGIPASDVWSAYVGVWHMDKILEDPATGKHYTPDSSASGWHAYKAVEEDAVPAPVTSATGVTAHPAPFTGTAMDIAYNTGKASSDLGGFIVPASQTASTTLNGPGFTLSSFVNSQKSSSDGRCRVIAFGNAYNDRANLAVGKDYIHCMSSTNHKKNNPGGATGWVYASAVFGSKSFIYANGLNLSGSAGDNPNLTSMTLEKGIGLGCFTDGKQCLDGYLDETRIRNAASSADWIAAEYAAIVNDVVSFGQVTIVDAATPVLAAPTFVRNQDGSFTITVSVSENVPASVVCTLGGTDYPMSTSDPELPMSYSVTVSDLATGTYVPNVTAVSTTGNPVYAACLTAFHAGALTVTKVSDADEGTLSPGVFRVSRADADATDLPALTFDVAFSGDGLAAVVAPTATTLTIPAGALFAEIEITPVYVADVDEDTYLQLTVSGTNIGQSSSGTMTIVNASFDPAVRYVATGGNDANHGGTPELPKKTIASAISSLANVAKSQVCTVNVAPGRYNVSKPISVTAAIHIVGDEADPSRVVVSNTVSPNWNNKNFRCLLVNHASAWVSGLTFENGQNYYSGGNIQIDANGGVVSNCIIRAGMVRNDAAYGSNAAIVGPGTITHCTIQGGYVGAESGSSGKICSVYLGHASARIENSLIDGFVVLSSNTKGGNGLFVESGTALNCTVVNTQYNVQDAERQAKLARIKVTGSGVAKNCVSALNADSSGILRAFLPGQTGSLLVNCAFDGIAGSTNALSGMVSPVVGTADEFFPHHADDVPYELKYRPKSGGPLADAGANYDGMALYDLSGSQKRKIGSRVDIGCYESNGAGTMLLIK